MMLGGGSFWSFCPEKGLVAARLRTSLLNTEWIQVYGESSSLYELWLTFCFTEKGPQYLSSRLALGRSFLALRFWT